MKVVTSKVVKLLRVYRAPFQSFKRVIQGCISRDHLNSNQEILCDLIEDQIWKLSVFSFL